MIACLVLSSFRGSIGAEHYYGRVRLYNDAMKFGNEKIIDMERVLDDPIEVAYLQKKDDYDWVEGDTTSRFNDKQTIEAAAITWFESYPERQPTDLLVVEEKLFDPERGYRYDSFRALAGDPDKISQVEKATPRDKTVLVMKWKFEDGGDNI